MSSQVGKIHLVVSLKNLFEFAEIRSYLGAKFCFIICLSLGKKPFEFRSNNRKKKPDQSPQLTLSTPPNMCQKQLGRKSHCHKRFILLTLKCSCPGQGKLMLQHVWRCQPHLAHEGTKASLLSTHTSTSDLYIIDEDQPTLSSLMPETGIAWQGGRK